MVHCMKKGSFINDRDHDERTALHGAVMGNHPDICHLLIQYGANPNIKDNRCRLPLHDACSLNYFDVANVLITGGSSLSAGEAHFGRTPLHLCAELGFTDLAERLIIRGSDLMDSGDKVGACRCVAMFAFLFHQLDATCMRHTLTLHGALVLGASAVR